LTAPAHKAFTLPGQEVKDPVTRKEVIPLLLLIAIVTVRSWIQLGLVSYIPFYYINYLNGDPLYAGKLVSTFLMAGAAGTLLGSPLADRWGYKKFLTLSLFLMFPILILFYHTQGIFLFLTLAVAGMVLVSTFGLTVVMAQTIIPQRLGMASGLLTGFAIGAGGMGVTLLGIIADHWGVPAALKAILILPLIGFGLCLLVKYPPSKSG
jgi:FSR family fosmidomycin resistance protein-like MFS transporter